MVREDWWHRGDRERHEHGAFLVNMTSMNELNREKQMA